jgi:hypothetical protein
MDARRLRRAFFVARATVWRKQKFALQHFGDKQET